MTALTRLEIHDFRNIQEAELSFSPGFNLFYGNNGSGKTSLLEAIYLLAHGRSFRSHMNNRLIQHDQSKMTLFAKTDHEHRLGMEKMRSGGTNLRFNGEKARSIAILSEHIPLQLIHPDRFRLVADSAQYRRQFMDWGLFHVEHRFLPVWRSYQSALNQRNAALKMQLPSSQLSVWDEQLALLAEQLHDFRHTFVVKFIDAFQKILPKLLKQPIEIQYKPGWDTNSGFEKILESCLYQDRRQGFTTKGPHRADLKFYTDNLPASTVLSRGQQKLLVCALALTHIHLLEEATGKKSMFLFDDLPSELDKYSRKAVLDVLFDFKGQVFITGIEKESLSFVESVKDLAMFHVEHGEIKLIT